MLKKILNSLFCFLIMILTSTLILTFLNYFNILKPSMISVLKLVIPILAMFTSGYKLGKNSEKNGYLEGIKIGGIVIFIFFIFVLLLDKLSIKSFLYYLILLLTSILSSMIGINRKKINKS